MERVTRCTLHVARCTLRVLRVALTAAVVCSAPASTASGQTAQQLELLRQNPELVRQRIQQSGLTPEQIRSRLQSAGYSANLLDPFLRSEGAVSSDAVSASMLQALEALGVPIISAEGLEPVPTLTGTVITPGVEEARGLPLFGADVFRRTTQFQPLLSGPVPSNYRVGPGDVLVMVLTGDVELVHELSVTREGFVVVPQVGQLYLNNLTMAQVNTLLRDRLGRSYSGIRTGTTRFDVTVARLRTIQVYVVGEVSQPGAYQLASVATVLNALYAAGGPTRTGNFRAIAVRRGDSTAVTLDLYDYLARGETTNDIMLEQGDVVFVPVRGSRVAVTGAVVRPGRYEAKEEETLQDVVELSGGFRADAEFRRVTVHRILPAAERGPGPFPRAAIEVPLATMGAGVAIPSFGLEDGDSIVIDSIPGFEQGLYVSIGGMVHKPGAYAWREGMTLRDLLSLAQGTRVGAGLREAEIARLPADRGEGELARRLRVPMDSTYLSDRDASGRYVGAAGLGFPAPGTAPETTLEPFDQITILRQPEFELQRTVWITGEVTYPGPYAITRKDERVSDLLQRAGGLLPTAHSDGARFYRKLDAAGRINLELDQAVANRGGRNDVILQPGDSLAIPEYVPTVRVQGAVVAPTSVLYAEGAGIEYYIGNAGGYARDADKGRVSVRYANGSAEVRTKQLFFSSSPTPGPGSVVSVQTKPQAEPTSLAQVLGVFAQVLTSAVAVIAIVVR